MNKKGFTIIEIMIAVGIIGLLVGIAMPQFIKVRMSSRENICIANLRQIDKAKDMWAVWEGKQTADEPIWEDLVPDYIEKKPACPAGGTYMIASVDTNPSCSVKNHSISD